MGCNCGGSTRRSGEKRQASEAPARTDGGPGSPEYTWNGPKRRESAEPPAEPADKKS